MTADETIRAVLTWQANPHVDPLTCAADRQHGKLIPKETPAGVVLICQRCDYSQAHIPDAVLRG